MQNSLQIADVVETPEVVEIVDQPIELTFEQLEQVGGGQSPNSTWGSPNSSW